MIEYVVHKQAVDEMTSFRHDRIKLEALYRTMKKALPLPTLVKATIIGLIVMYRIEEDK